MGYRAAAFKMVKGLNRDPRHWQIMALSSLFAISFSTSDFGAQPLGLGMAMLGALGVQAAGTVWINLTAQARRRGDREGRQGNHWMRPGFRSGLSAVWNGFAWKSALITALSLSILLRANSPWLWLAAGAVGVGAKFLLRYRGKHLFNPACIGIVAVSVLAGDNAWVSPGQWGQAPIFAAFAIGFAGLVLSSAKRLDIALVFLGGFGLMLVGRALYLGDPVTIPMHQMQSGALLVFAFFMITDPRSTPDSRMGRIVFALAVAALAAWLGWQFHLRGAMLYALAVLAVLTPVLDRVLPAKRFQWSTKEGHDHEPETPGDGMRTRARLVRA